MEEGNTYYFALVKDKSEESARYDVNEDYSKDIYAEWDYITYGTIFERKEITKEKL